MSQNINNFNQTSAYSDFNKPSYQTQQEADSELCGCLPKQIVPIIKILLCFIMLGSVIGFILSIIGACKNGDDWKGDQPQESYALFITNTVLCALIFIIALLVFIQLQTKNFDTGIKIELMFVFILAFLACSLAGGIIINSIDQTSSIAYSCSQVYSKIWPSSILDASQLASQNFCSQSCPCAYTSKSQLTYPLSGYFDLAGPVNAIGCKSYVPLSGSTANLLKSLEIDWKCAGICEVSERYLFSDINRGKPNQEQSCFAVASQKLYPLRNLFLGGDFSISLLQVIIMLFLLRMKSFLNRDDVRLAEMVQKVGDSEKQNLYAGSSIGQNQNGSIIHDQSSIIKQDPNSSMVYPAQQQAYASQLPIQNKNSNEYNQNQNYIKKESFHQPLAAQVLQPVDYQQASSLPKQQAQSLPKQQAQSSLPQQYEQPKQQQVYQPNQVVPLTSVINNNIANNPYNDDYQQPAQEIKQENQQYQPYSSDLEYQLERDKKKQQSNEYYDQPPIQNQQTFAPQSQNYNNYEQPIKQQQEQSPSPVRQNYVQSEQKKVIEHPPVDNLFDDNLPRNKSNLNYSQPPNNMNKSNINHPLSLIANGNTRLPTANSSFINTSPIKRANQTSQPQGGFSVLAATGNQSIQNRPAATQQLFLDDDQYSTPISNVEMVKPKSQVNTSRAQNNVISLNLDGSLPNSSYQLNGLPRSTVSQNQSTVNNNNNNTNKKFFTKQNNANNLIV